MATIAGIESPKWTSNDHCGETLTIVATKMDDGRWQAFGPWADGSAVITGIDPEALIHSMVNFMEMWSRAGQLRLPNLLLMQFADESKQGLERFGKSWGYSFSIYEKPDHVWSPAWKALAG